MKHLVFLILLMSSSLLLAEKPIGLSQITLYSGTSSRLEFISNESSSFLDLYWNKGINFGIGLEVKITDYIYFNPTYELNYYKFDTFFYGGQVPELILISSQGDNSFIHRYLLYLKLKDSKSSIFNPFVTTGVGYVYEDIGKIEIEEKYLDFKIRNNTINSDEKNYLIHSIGIGFEILLLERLFILFEPKYYSNYSDRFHYSINFGFGMNL